MKLTEDMEGLLVEFDEYGFAPTITMPNAEEYAKAWRNNLVDLFERLCFWDAEQKAEIERLTSLYDRKSGFMTSSIGDLPLTVEGLRKAVDEISRLLTVQGELQELNIKYYNEAKDLRRENAELQKQVDELTAEKEDLHFQNKNLQTYIDNHEPIWKRNTERAVKATAKEIFKTIFDDCWAIKDENLFDELDTAGFIVNMEIIAEVD